MVKRDHSACFYRTAIIACAVVLCGLGICPGWSIHGSMGSTVVVRHADDWIVILGKQSTLTGHVVVEMNTGTKLSANKVISYWDAKGKRIIRMEVSGNVEIVQAGITMHSNTVTGYLNPDENAFDRVEANGNVVFHGAQTAKDGSRRVVDGEGDRMRYEVVKASGEAAKLAKGVTVPGKDFEKSLKGVFNLYGKLGKEANVHVVTYPAENLNESATGEKIAPQVLDMLADWFVYDMQNGILTSHNVQGSMDLPPQTARESSEPSKK
jgi:lipopolysaccharide export system protein LptA